MKKTTVIIAAILSIFGSEIYACTPCLNTLDFNETVKQSELIIIGEKVSDGPWTGPKNSQYGPAWVDVKVHEVLKGESNESAITVFSWIGMCPYGIQIGDGKHVLYLKEQKDESKDYQFFPSSCSLKSHSIQDDMVVVNEMGVSMEKFLSNLNQNLDKE